MKISNETKVGAIALVSITILILGYSFLKGNNVFNKSMTIYGSYANVQGLAPSNPVMINGWQVGRVNTIEADKDLRKIMVSLNIYKDINIPSNSVAIIKPNPITNTSIEIILGDAKTFLKDQESISTEANSGLLEEIAKEVNPVLAVLKKAAGSLDSLIKNINSTFDPKAKNNIGASLEHINELTYSLQDAAASIKNMLDPKSGSVTRTMDNLNSVTGNFAANNEKINHILNNLDSASQKIAALELNQTVQSLQAAIQSLQSTLQRMNNGEGTAGKLLNDDLLYNNLAATSYKLNILIDDIRIHPKRYTSIFKSKNKIEAPLMQPLPDSSQPVNKK
jgi:phospholipid/cholesterol/gamma-HCH transport system substrate-binding protein